MLRTQPMRTAGVLVLVMVLLVSSTALATSAVAGTQGVAYSTNDTTSNDAEATAECAAEGPPTMSSNRLYAAETTITEDQEGIIEGSFRVDPTEAPDCTIMVDVEMQVPSGLEIRGGDDFEQMGGGIVVGTFEMEPGELRDIRAHVYARDDGLDEATVIADYEIWYEGDRENSYQQSGLRFTFNIEGPNPPGDDELPVPFEWGLIGLVGIAITGLVVVAKNDVIVNVLRRN